MNGDDLVRFEEAYHEMLVEKFSLENPDQYDELVYREYVEYDAMLRELELSRKGEKVWRIAE